MHKTADSYHDHKEGKHRDSSVVDVDVQRSLWAWTEGMHLYLQYAFNQQPTLQHPGEAMHADLRSPAGWSDAQREAKRKDLRFVLDAAVCSQDGTIFYYQGLHDIASVLLLNMGDTAAYETLTHLSLCQLRDCTRYVINHRLSACLAFC